MATNGHISFERELDAFGPITLDEMKSVKLMNRVDAKFLTSETGLQAVLADAAAAGYRVLVTEGERQSPYDSVYFDTPGLQMFLDHHNRRLVRQKVRTRCYVRSGQAFLEIKRKNNHGRTSKKRMAIEPFEMMEFSGNAEACAYLAKHSWFTARGNALYAHYAGESGPYGTSDHRYLLGIQELPYRKRSLPAGRRHHRAQAGRPRTQPHEGDFPGAPD